MPDRSNGSASRRPRAQPRQLLDAALALFIERGFAAARAEDIAARAGVSKATLYLHFRSKEDLFKAAILERLAACFVVEIRGATEPRSSSAVLREVLSAWRSALFEGRAGGVLMLVLTEARSFPALAGFWTHDVLEPARRVVGGVVSRGIDRGELRPVDPDLVAHALVLPMLLLCMHQHARGLSGPNDLPSDATHLFSHHFEHVLESLALHRPDAPSAGAAPTTA